ncbi:hypothetical protein [Streptomyces sp. PvR034]|uniref:hypothetical protein n=1 Tax=Streptomyces sp. PvR034 TaxID=3156401 RepID=UPI003395BB31
MGAVLRANDPLARLDRLVPADLADRRWFQFSEGTHPLWRSYGNGGAPRADPLARAVQECLQGCSETGRSGRPRSDAARPGGVVVPLSDVPRSRAVAAWNGAPRT